MTPLQRLTAFIRDLLSAGRGATPAQVEQLRQMILHAADHGGSAEDFRTALRDAADVSNQPDARSFATDSGIGASRRP